MKTSDLQFHKLGLGLVLGALMLVCFLPQPLSARNKASQNNAPQNSATDSGKSGGSNAAASMFSTRCAMCHGEDGVGTDMGKSLKVLNLRSPQVQKMSNADLTNAVANGKGSMPPFAGSLSKQDIQSLVKYVRTQFGKGKTADQNPKPSGSDKSQK